MVCHTKHVQNMENLPAWAITALLGLIGSAIGVISYFLKRRDTEINDMAKERKQTDQVLYAKIDTVLINLNNVNTEMVKIKTEITNIKETVHKDFVRIETTLKDTAGKVNYNQAQIADMRTQLASLVEWKRQSEK